MLNRAPVCSGESRMTSASPDSVTWLVQALFISSLLLVIPAIARSSMADEKPQSVKEPPKILMTLPLAVSPGHEHLLVVRGLRMDEVTSVQLAGLAENSAVTIVKKEKSAPPERVEASVVGDSLAEIRFTLPADFAQATLPVSVISESGMSAAFDLLVLPHDQIVAEVEPNDSLRKAQPIAAGKLISGQIGQARDVDVYEFTAEAGQTVAAEVMAARYGSPLDAQLTLFDSSGQIVAIADDSEQNRDASLETKLSGSGPWRLVLLDATDRGNSLNSYHLKLTIK